MATRANYVKVGVFVLLGSGAAVVLAIVVGVLHARKETDSYVTYFTESVQGLEVDAPVKARGVTIGRVAKISLTPEERAVEVRMDLDAATLKSMGYYHKSVPPDVRVQLASQGLVGSRFLDIDSFDPKTHPPPVLQIAPPAMYIPSTPSLQKSVEDSLRVAMDRLAQVMDSIVREGLTEKLSQSVTHADDVLTEIDQAVKGFNREKVPARAAAAIDQARVALDSMNKALERVNGDAGLIASANRAVGSFGELERTASSATSDLERTLEDLRAAAAAIRSLAEELERNPDMLVKGIGRPRAP